jgi:outer membrane autotransporter protein
MCFSTGVYGIGSDGTKLGGVYAVLGRQVSDRVRAGVVVDKGLNKISVGNVSATSNTPSLGGYVNWNMYPDGQGLALRASGSVTSNNLIVNRDSTPYSEAAQGKTSANGYAYQLKASYTMLPTAKRFNVTPYIGVRRSSLAINGFTETGAQYPLSYNSLTQSTTDALAGASMSYDFNDKLAGFVSAGMIKNLSYSAGALSGTSDIIGMSTFNSQLPAQGYTSPIVGAGLSYDVAKNQVVTVSTGWQQKTLTNTSQITGSVNYTVGF